MRECGPDDGRSLRSSALTLRLRAAVPAAGAVHRVRPRPPAGREPRVPVPGRGGRRPRVSHLPAATHPAAGHALRTHLLPGVSHQLPAGERLLPCVQDAPNAAELQEAQPAGAQAAGQAYGGLSLRRALQREAPPRGARGPHQEQVGAKEEEE